MNVVIGNSIKIEVTVDFEPAAFIANYFNQSKLIQFLFHDQESNQTPTDFKFNNEIKVGDDVMILQSDYISVETHVSHLDNQKTGLLILVDVFDENLSINTIINNVISNTEFISKNKHSLK